MAQRGQHTTLQQRVELSERAAAGLTDRAMLPLHVGQKGVMLPSLSQHST